MSLLTMVQDACDKVGIPRLSTVVGSSSPDARQMLVIANQEGNEQSRRTAWQALTKERRFFALAQEEQTGALPTDYRFMINETFYNRTRQRIVQGPIPPGQWQQQKATVSQIYFDQYRLRNNAILLMPTPNQGDEYAFEYVSRYWATDAAGNEQPYFLADSDIPQLNELAMTQGIIWRWKVVKGLDYAEDYRSYEVTIADLINRDGSKRTISMGGPIIVSGLTVQEGSWPL